MTPQVQLILTVGGVVIAVLSLIGVVYTAKSGRRASTEERAEVWNAGYRAAAEEHLQYDVERLEDIRQLRTVVNHLEERLGLQMTAFEPIPKAPALFPKLASK